MAGDWGPPQTVLTHTADCLNAQGITVSACSSWIVSKAYGVKNQADFINGALIVKTHKPPMSLLYTCQKIERQAGRRPGPKWGPRVLDIDILAYHDVIIGQPGKSGVQSHSHRLILPHPGLAGRPFVLQPLAEIAPRWHHPLTGLTARQMLRQLRPSRGGEIINHA